jgi:hypothetical protein
MSMVHAGARAIIISVAMAVLSPFPASAQTIPHLSRGMSLAEVRIVLHAAGWNAPGRPYCRSSELMTDPLESRECPSTLPSRFIARVPEFTGFAADVPVMLMCYRNREGANLEVTFAYDERAKTYRDEVSHLRFNNAFVNKRKCLYI